MIPAAGMGVSPGGGIWGGAAPASPVWRDPRVLVPAAVSALALLLTITTVCVCLRKSKLYPFIDQIVFMLKLAILIQQH